MELLPPSMYEVGVGLAVAFIGVMSALDGDFGGIQSPATPGFREQDDKSFKKIILATVLATGVTYIARNIIHSLTK